MRSRSVVAVALLVLLVLALPEVQAFAWEQGSPCDMAEQAGGKALYYNILCFFDWLVTWT